MGQTHWFTYKDALKIIHRCGTQKYTDNMYTCGHTRSLMVTNGHTQTVGHTTPENICKHPQITNGDMKASPQLHTRSYRHTFPCAQEAQPGQSPGQAGGKASGVRHSSGGKGKELGKRFICSQQETHPAHHGNLALAPEWSLCTHHCPAVPGSGYWG